MVGPVMGVLLVRAYQTCIRKFIVFMSSQTKADKSIHSLQTKADKSIYILSNVIISMPMPCIIKLPHQILFIFACRIFNKVIA